MAHEHQREQPEWQDSSPMLGEQIDRFSLHEVPPFSYPTEYAAGKIPLRLDIRAETRKEASVRLLRAFHEAFIYGGRWLVNLQSRWNLLAGHLRFLQAMVRRAARGDSFSAPEARQKVAPGVSPGWDVEGRFSPGRGGRRSFRPCRGSWRCGNLYPGLTPGANFSRPAGPVAGLQ